MSEKTFEMAADVLSSELVGAADTGLKLQNSGISLVHSTFWECKSIFLPMALLQGNIWSDLASHSCKEPFSGSAFPRHTWRSKYREYRQFFDWFSVNSAILRITFY